MSEETTEKDIVIDTPLLGNDTTFINFKEELEFFNSVPLNEPIYYNYQTAEFLRKVKLLLSLYDYGHYAVLAGNVSVLNGMVVEYIGEGKNAGITSPIIYNASWVVIIKIPDKDETTTLYLKVA